MAGFIDCAGVRLMLEGSSKTVQPAAGVCHYFYAEGIEAVARDLKNKDVAFEGDPHLIAKKAGHELWMAYFRDPDAHLLALMEEKR